jgi:transcriptional regulator with XRE-family HTH domain
MFQKIKDPEYRKLFIAGQIKHGFATQLRALRKARKMTQQELAELAETTQTVISRIENNGAAKLSVQSLLKIAYAFDVALIVRLDPIDRLIDWVDDLSPEVMTPKPSEEILEAIERGVFAKAAKYKPMSKGAKASVVLSDVDETLDVNLNRYIKAEQMPVPKQFGFSFKSIKEVPRTRIEAKKSTARTEPKFNVEKSPEIDFVLKGNTNKKAA